MRQIAFCISLPLLAGCNMPPPPFMGIEPTRVEVGQSVFDVRIKGNQAHALRVNAEYAPRLGAVALRARQAIAMVSGCEVVDGSLTGDPIFITAELRC